MAAWSTPRIDSGASSISCSSEPSLDARQHQQVADDGVQAIHLPQHDLQEAVGVLLVLERAVHQRFDEALDRRDRGPQFVGDVGHEVAAHVFQMAQPRDVVQDDQHADLAPLRVVQHRAVGADPAVLRAANLNLALDRRRAGQRRFDELQQVRPCESLRRRCALAAWPAPRPAGSRRPCSG